MSGGLSKVIRLVFWAIVFYLFLFQPFINKRVYLAVEVLLVLSVISLRPKSFADNLALFKYEYIYAFLICGYSLMVDLSHPSFVYSDRFFASFFQAYLVSYLFVLALSNSSFLQKNLESCLFLVCFLACSITILAVLIPEFGRFCINHATEDLKSRLVDLYVDGNYSQYRTYGLSESLNFTYAYVLSIVGAYLLSERLRFFTPILILMIIVAIVFNARIAFVPLMISLFYILFLRQNKLQGISSIFVIVALCFPIALWVLYKFPSLYSSWGLSFFDELFGFLSGQEDNTVGTLLGRMWIIPDNVVDLIFGTGESLFLKRGGNSDVGYILQLNYGGLILLSMILLYFLYISRRLLKYLSIHHWFPIIFIVSIFVLNFKGFYLAAIPGNRFLTFLYVYYIYAARKGVYELNPGQPLI